MFRRKVKIKSKRSLRPFQRDYVKDVGSVFTFSTALTMFFLVLIFCIIVYKIIEAIRI